jgi:hypothetical protein
MLLFSHHSHWIIESFLPTHIPHIFDLIRSTGYLSLAYSRVTPVLAEAIKELTLEMRAELLKLKYELNSLKEQLSVCQAGRSS